MANFKSIIKIHAGINNVKLDNSFKYISGFTLLKLQHSNEYCFESEDSEIGLIIFEGVCDIKINGQEHRGLGKRKDVFTGSPTGVYIPIASHFSIKGEEATLAICRARCSQKTEPAIIYPEDVVIRKTGKGNWEREVRIIIGPDAPSVNLIVGETFNPPGNWSGIPPARHEKNNLPDESRHEEIYYFKTNQSQGWGIERIYSPERNVNEFVYLQDSVVTFMPWGYHQIVAAPGYGLYYLFFLAGEGKQLVQFEDPQHSWIKQE